MHSQKEIAFQAGVSLATVDRVIHARPGVKERTKARVQAAIRELDRQAVSVAMDGKRLAIDVIIEAPKRFSTAVRTAFEAELEGLRPASIRLRFHMTEMFDEDSLDQLLRSISRRGTHGLVVKLPDRLGIVRYLEQLKAKRIPIVTFVTDLPTTSRLEYIGMDNHAAGRLASYLVQKTRSDGDVLITVSSNEFEGEAARLEGFHSAPTGRSFHLIHGTMGRDAQTGEKVSALLDNGIQIGAVYSAGGGNRAVLNALKDANQTPDVFIAHDLDADNRGLLRDGEIDFVIHHNLRHDARACCQHILKAHRLLPIEFEVPPSVIQLATPFNLDSI